MSFLRPSLGRNGHAAPDASPSPLPSASPSVGEARTRALGVMSAEVERLADVYADALRESDEKLAKANLEIEALRAKLRAMRALLDLDAPSSESVP